jgi:glutaconate CoA-transferase subunit A
VTAAAAHGGAGAVQPLAEAIAAHVGDGDTVFLGGFGHAIPFAAGHELIRQERRGLTLVKTGADILFDQLIAAGCVARLVFGWMGNPGIGLGHAFRRALGAGELEIEEWTNFSMMLRFHAATLGVPYLPARVLQEGDVGSASARVAAVTCPFTGEALTAIPALAPDVALVHAQRADPDGNVQLWGIVGDTAEGALAAQRIVATVEEIVPREVVRADPNRTVIPAYRVDAVCEVPWGAHPSYVSGYYTRDDELYREYDALSRSPDELAAYLAAAVAAGPGPERVPAARRAVLGVPDVPPAPVNYGYRP